MFLPAHLRRSRHGVYYFRIVLPDGLKEVFGKREFIRSLGTKCPRQARLAAGLLSSTLAVKRSEGAAAFARAIVPSRPKSLSDCLFLGWYLPPSLSVSKSRPFTSWGWWR